MADIPVLMEKQISLKDTVHFTARQLEATAVADKCRYTLFGGAAGPGKSYWLRWYPVRQLIKWGKTHNLRGIHGALFSKDFPTLKDRQVSKMEVEFPRWLGEIKDSKTEGLAFHLRPQWGGHILALRNLDDPSKYLSSEFAIIAVEELTENKEEVFVRLRNRLRWTGIERTQFIAATNPGGIGHSWVRKLWIDKIYAEEEHEPHEFGFVPAWPKDNPYLAKSYLMQLASLPEQLRKAYLDGNWNVFEGQYFAEWDKAQHVVTPFEIPSSYKRFRSYDHGRLNAATCGWYAIDYDGRVIVYRELYVKGMNVDQIASEINRLSEGEIYEYSVADPAIFANIGFIDRFGGQTIAESFARNGIQFIPASNRRIDGWALMHQYLHWDTQTPPKLIYFSTCTDSIRTIPALIHDEHKVEDIDTSGDDHCFVGDTYIDTAKGKKRIRDLVGKEVYVNTLVGFRKCKSVRKTRKASVWDMYLQDGRIITVTADHQFLTTNGWKSLKDINTRYDALIQSDICIQSYLKLFKSLVVNGIIFVESIFKRMVSDYTLLFGNTTMELSQRDTTCIIKTTIGRTIVLTIWNCIWRLNIFLSMLLRQKQNDYRQSESSNMRCRKQERGINQKLVENGIVSKPERTQKSGYGLKRIVQYVGENIRHLKARIICRNIVILIVKCVPYGEEEVYNLTVPHIEHFTVNGGIVVHNCADRDRYLLMSLHERRSLLPKNEIEKKLEQIQQRDRVRAIRLNDYYYD